MSNTIDSQSYPQFITGNPALARNAGVSCAGFEDFRIYPAVQNRPHSIESWEQTHLGLLLTLQPSAKTAIPSFTHETPIDLYDKSDATVERLYLHVQLWSDTIFRIVFSKDKEIADPFAGIPEDARMLVGKPAAVSFTVEENDAEILITTEKITIHIDKTTTGIRAAFVDGEVFFSQRKEEFQTNDIHDLALAEYQGNFACFEAVDLEPDELIYGLGERFDGLARNGRTVDFHNKDAIGTTSPRTYVNIPFYMSTRGYGLFVNAGTAMEWQIGTRDASAIQFGTRYHQLDYFVIPGPHPKEILRGYCSLTGFSKLPPLWSFGLWMSRNSYMSWDVVDEVAQSLRSHDIPCDVLCLDTAWFAEDWNCDLKFSEDRFADPAGHMARFKDQGFRFCLWQYNFIPPKENNTNYQEAVANGYFTKDKDGNPYQLPETCQGGWTRDLTVDFSNPEARKWYAGKIANLIRLGAGVIKTDFGEGVSEDAIYHSIEGKHFHNLYTLLYNHTVFNAIHSVSGDNIVWARSGTAGSQRYPLHWGGDSQCSFDGLAGTLRGALSIGISGIPFFSHDIGGFIGTPDAELYVRWAQLGLFSSHSRCHGCGNTNFREPWAFGEEACDIFRFYDKLRYALIPYIYEEAEKCTRTGLPMMRALWLEYPEDRNVRHIEDQYLFGDSLLIAPVLKPLARSRIREVYLPKGTWFDYFTRQRIESNGMWIRREVDLKTMPIYVKEGTVLRYCAADTHLQNGMGEIVKTEHWV